MGGIPEEVIAINGKGLIVEPFPPEDTEMRVKKKKCFFSFFAKSMGLNSQM